MKTKNSKRKPTVNRMLPEYNSRGGVRRKYASQHAHSNNIVVIERDVAKYFSDSKSVNEALRTLVRPKGKNA